MVRPEHAEITDTADATLRGTLDSAVYFGTDTHCHMSLPDGAEIVARLQSLATGEDGLTIGQPVGLHFMPGALQVLED